ncbi:MAG: DUF2064 domain-containing protein, partial [bacterium]
EGADLGQRLTQAFRELFRLGYTRILIIGIDCLALTPSFLVRSFAALERHEVVIGPSASGGFYLLGLRRLPRGLLDNVPWGTPGVFDRALQNTAQAGLPSLILPIHHEVETIEDAGAILGSSYANQLPLPLVEILSELAGIPPPPG